MSCLFLCTFHYSSSFFLSCPFCSNLIFCAFSERGKILCLASWRLVLPSTPILPDEPFNCCSMSLMVFNRGSRENKDFALSRKMFVLPKVVEIVFKHLPRPSRTVLISFSNFFSFEIYS